MKTVLGYIGLSLLTLIVILGFSWLAMGNEFFLYKAFAPKMEQVRRETFEQSKAYNQGMIQDLQNMQFEYYKADKDGKQAMASIILHRSADYDENKLPTDLRDFIEKLKSEQSGGNWK